MACGPKHADHASEDDDLSELDPVDKPATCTQNTPAHWAEQVELGGGGETEIERRQNAACDAVMPKLTSCAVEDACAKLEPGKLAELDLEHTAPIHLRENLKGCKGTPMSSRQVRVFEVCMHEETECAPLVACLENAQAE